MKEEKKEWSYVITPQAGNFSLRIRELWQARELILLFVRRDFIAAFKQTILGPLWFLIQPAFTTLVFTVMFGNFARLSPGNVPAPVFYLTGIVLWNYFAECIIRTSATFINNSGLMGKVYFPRIALPVSVVMSSALRFSVQLFLLLLVWSYFLFTTDLIKPNYTMMLMLPLLLLIAAGLGMGMGLIISSFTIRYRDLQQLVVFGVQLAMFISPVIFPLSTMENNTLRTIVLINPMSSLIEYMRGGFLGLTEALNPFYLLYSGGFMLVVLLIGLYLFNRVERNFIDTI